MREGRVDGVPITKVDVDTLRRSLSWPTYLEEGDLPNAVSILQDIILALLRERSSA